MNLPEEDVVRVLASPHDLAKAGRVRGQSLENMAELKSTAFICELAGEVTAPKPNQH